MNEAELQAMVQIEGAKFLVNLERNNNVAFMSQDGRMIRAGLGNISKKHSDTFKSSDLIGIKTMVVTPDMVGKTIGIFIAVECKDPTWNVNKKLDARESAQKKYIDYVVSRGGIAGFVNSIDSFLKLIGRL